MSADLEQRVEELEERVKELESAIDGAEVVSSQTDLEAFLDRVSPGTHVERATAIGYYFVHEDDSAPFTVDDVKDAYEKCRTQKPANLSDVLAGAEERGWLMRAGSEGRHQLWTVTTEGDNAVAGGFE